MSDKNKKPSKFSAVAQRMRSSESLQETEKEQQASEGEKAVGTRGSHSAEGDSVESGAGDANTEEEVSEPVKRATTIYLREDQLVELKVQAARKDTSMTSIISGLVDEAGYCDEEYR